MSAILLLYPYLDSDRASYFELKGRLCVEAGEAEISGILEKVTKKTHIALILPAEQTFLFNSTRQGNRRQLRQAAPWILEEFTTRPIESQHVALDFEKAPAYTRMAMLDKHLMQKYVQGFQDMGVERFSIHPAGWLLDKLLPEGGVWLAEETVLVACEGQYYLLDKELADDQTLSSMGLDVSGGIRALNPFPSDNRVVPQKNWQFVPLASPSLADDVSALLKSDLCQGEFVREPSWPWLASWKLAAMLAVLVLGLLAGDRYLELREMDHQVSRLEENMLLIYKDSFPDSGRVVSPYRQMQQRLGKLSPGGQLPFQDILAMISTELKSVQGLSLESIAYRDGTLKLTLGLDKVQSLDELAGKLKKFGRLDISHSAVKSVSGYSGELQVRIRDDF